MKALFAFYDEIEEWAGLHAEFPEIDFVFAQDIDGFSKEIADTDILFILAPRYDKHIAGIVKSKAGKLKWIQATTVGVEDILFNGVPDGVVITKAMGIFDVSVAEQTMALLLAFLRQVSSSTADKQKSEYNRALRWDNTRSLERKNVGIVGYGRIGRQVAKRIKAFDARVLAYDVAAIIKDEFADEIFTAGQFEDFLPKCDIVILTLPLTKDNKYMFNKDTFGLMKKGGVLINVSRGKLVNETDLVEALRDGVLAGAGLDVYEEEPLQSTSELWRLDNVVMTPHIAGMSEYNNERLADLFRTNIGKFLNNETMMFVVDIDSAF